MALPSLAEIQHQLTHIHEDRSIDIVISNAICLPLAVIAVVLRLLSRRIVKASVKADDWTVISAVLLGAGKIAGEFLCVRLGGGKHAILLKDPVEFARRFLQLKYYIALQSQQSSPRSSFYIAASSQVVASGSLFGV